MTRLRIAVVMLAAGLAGLSWTPAATAQPGWPVDSENEALDRKREEILDKQITVAWILGSAVGIGLLVLFFLNNANSREKKLSERHKRKRPLDPDAPLEYAAPPPLPPLE